ncbi:hypothetical protein K458DRAFT_54597 [Lentithecium fluviatile CBS 122367]|uniref:Uncharacterized protein n=1 Tax=Lentithecium fluviatile CBS 122367 TaxID=1168545 RepID=A0A6G1IWX5_9PLEO|nr:hypothetical protein K458DRAFT_54597 [Lentithecium fluviatile CBS 122367]
MPARTVLSMDQRRRLRNASIYVLSTVPCPFWPLGSMLHILSPPSRLLEGFCRLPEAASKWWRVRLLSKLPKKARENIIAVTIIFKIFCDYSA